MVEYKIIFSKLADKDKKLLKQAGLESKAKELLDLIAINPYQTPPTYEKLKGNLCQQSYRWFSNRPWNGTYYDVM